MKLWIRFFLAALVGVLLGLLLPLSGGDTLAGARFVAELIVNAGRYVVFPVVLFGLAIGVRELREDRKLVKLSLWTTLMSVITSAVAVLLGTVAIMVLAPPRIPPVFQESSGVVDPNFAGIVQGIFPPNLFAVFDVQGYFLLPVAVLALIIGIALSRDDHGVNTLAEIADAAGSLMYRVMNVAIDIVGIGFVALTTALVLQVRSVTDYEIYANLIVIICFIIGLLVLVIYPLIIYLFGGRTNPYLWLYTQLAPAIAAFSSGNIYFSFPSLVRAGSDNMGVPRHASTAMYTITTILARAGTAMVTSMTFLLLVRSYTALEISLGDIFMTMSVSFGISFALSSLPGAGVLVSLSVLAGMYGGGLEEVYLIVLTVTPLLAAHGTESHPLTAGFIGRMVSYWEGYGRDVPIREQS